MKLTNKKEEKKAKIVKMKEAIAKAGAEAKAKAKVMKK